MSPSDIDAIRLPFLFTIKQIRSSPFSMTFNAFLIEVEGKTTKSELNFIRSFALMQLFCLYFLNYF